MSNNIFLKGLGRNIVLLGFVSLFTDMSSEMVFPLIPLYLLSLGSGAWIVGLVFCVRDSLAPHLAGQPAARDDVGFCRVVHLGCCVIRTRGGFGCNAAAG